MKPLILPGAMGLTAGIVVARPQTGRLSAGRILEPDHGQERRRPRKAFILSCLLALAAVSSVVAVTQSAEAGRPDVIIVDGSNRR